MGTDNAGRRRRAARGAWRLALALALAASLCCPAAANAADGSLTVNARANEGAVYEAYRVFDGDVDASGNVTGAAWPDAKTGEAVLAYLDGNGYADFLAGKGWTYEGAREEAVNAAQFCAQEIRGSRGRGTPGVKDAGTFAAGLASAVASAGLTAARVEAGKAAALPQGYYLVTTHSRSVGAGEAATAPVWTAVGESTVVSEKASAPSVKVEVRNSGSAPFAAATDALHGQEVECRATVTLPSNLAAFPSYPLTLSPYVRGPGSYVAGSMAVVAAGTDVTERLRGGDGGALKDAGDLSVRFDDLLATCGPSASSGKVVVTFKVSRGTAPNYSGSGGNPYMKCECGISYPQGPLHVETKASAQGEARVYSHTAVVSLTDASTGQPARTAGYTLQVVECADPALAGKYVNRFGELEDGAETFDNSRSDAVRVPGLAAGKYRIAQTKAPDSYPAQDADVILEIASAYDSLGGVAELKASVSGGYAASPSGSPGTGLGEVDAGLCTIEVATEVERVIAMPLTGLDPDGAAGCAAAALGAAGAALVAAGLARRRPARDGR